MSTILTAERELYEGVWTSVEQYGAHSPGEQYLPLFLQMVGEQRGTVLDAGCGSGKGALALRRAGFRVRMCDVTDAGLVDEAKLLTFHEACLWHNIREICHDRRSGELYARFDYVYCTDVLEHIPPQLTMLAVWQMLKVATKGLFLTVSLVPDSFGVWAGTPLHQTVQPFTWWKEALAEVGDVGEARDLINNAAFFVRSQ